MVKQGRQKEMKRTTKPFIASDAVICFLQMLPFLGREKENKKDLLISSLKIQYILAVKCAGKTFQRGVKLILCHASGPITNLLYLMVDVVFKFSPQKAPSKQSGFLPNSSTTNSLQCVLHCNRILSFLMTRVECHFKAAKAKFSSLSSHLRFYKYGRALSSDKRRVCNAICVAVMLCNAFLQRIEH